MSGHGASTLGCSFLYFRSLGLAVAPRVRFLQKALAKKEKSKKSGQSLNEIEKNKIIKKMQEFSGFGADSDDDDSDGDILTIKSRTTGKEVLSDAERSSDESKKEDIKEVTS